MKKIYTAIAILSLSAATFAQKNVILTVQHKLGDSNFSYNASNSNDVGSTFKFTRVEYYMSGFTIIHDGGIETPVTTDTYILTDAYINAVQSLGTFNVTNVEGIKFHIGVDAPTNNEDPNQWPMNHPLAPQSPSMHWGWAAGYFFAAVDGLAGTNLNTGFEMHSLGNVNYFEQTVTVNGENSGDDVYINLDADYLEAVRGINVNAGPIDHGAGATDLTLIQNFRDHVFSAAATSPLSVGVSTVNDFKVFPNPSNGVFYINSNEQVETIELFDLSGRKVMDLPAQQSGVQQVSIDQSGLYILQVRLLNQEVLRSKVVVE
jgi:hypothetical protein